jgi:hypothetical protein
MNLCMEELDWREIRSSDGESLPRVNDLLKVLHLFETISWLEKRPTCELPH